jgi:hypothetical protein
MAIEKMSLGDETALHKSDFAAVSVALLNRNRVSLDPTLPNHKSGASRDEDRFTVRINRPRQRNSVQPHSLPTVTATLTLALPN